MNKKIIPDGVFGILLFIFTEIMFFAGLISAYLIISSEAENWPPLNQPRLPVTSTAFNTLVLLSSGLLLFFTNRVYVLRDQEEPGKYKLCKNLFISSILLGVFFVLFQGNEWVRLIHYGLTMKSSTYGSFFYMIVGAHALHAVAALIALCFLFRKLVKHMLSPAQLWAGTAFWYFVVGIWPILYWKVYLT